MAAAPQKWHELSRPEGSFLALVTCVTSSARNSARMRPLHAFLLAAAAASATLASLLPRDTTPAGITDDAAVLRRLYDAALDGSPIYQNLGELVARFPGRLAGTEKLHAAGVWARDLLARQGADRTELQPVMVPHWERGAPESVKLLPSASSEKKRRCTHGHSLGRFRTHAGRRPSRACCRAPFTRRSENHRRARQNPFFNWPMNPRNIIPSQAYGEAAARAARWAKLFESYGTFYFRDEESSADAQPLRNQGAAVGEFGTDSQRYFDIHHTREDNIDKVNPRELELGTAAMAALVYLVNRHGL
jgi:hypothetical protein